MSANSQSLKDAEEANSSTSWRGSAMDEIYYGKDQWALVSLPPVANGHSHTVLYELPLDLKSTSPPKPHFGQMKWDSSHVRLPCSTQNEYVFSDEKDPDVPIKKARWEMIQTALLQPILTSYEFEAAILLYNPKYANKWKFHALHELFENELDEEGAMMFFTETLPEIIRLALLLPELIPTAIPLLKSGTDKSISLSQQQIACILANAFLCTFPRRNADNAKAEYRNYPTINFNTLFQTRHASDQVLEKIKGICYYLQSVCKKMPTGVVTFARRSKNNDDFPDWDKNNATFDSIKIHVSSDGTIEDNGCGLLQVDFANKFLGGGVLNYGCVQEEIRFIICPELLCSRLFTEQLAINECLIVMGCQRFSSYSGYASSFKWTGPFEDCTPFDADRRRKCTIVAIDAICFRQSFHQYKKELMKRELNKAYVGFYHELDTPAPGVATGNWGCGAFNGDKCLKSLLQLMVCCVTKRPLVYYTFGDTKLRDDLYELYEYLARNKISICTLWSYLKKFRYHKLPSEQLYPFLIQCHRDTGQLKLAKPVLTSSTIVNSAATLKSKTSLYTSKNTPETWATSDDDDLYLFERVITTEAQIHSAPRKEILISAKDTASTSALAVAKRKQCDNYDEIQSIGIDVITEYTSKPSETKEKRQRSLLDCLDDSYYKESPSSKLKRDLPENSPETQDVNESSLADTCMKSNDCVVQIENEPYDTNNKIKKLKISHDCDEYDQPVDDVQPMEIETTLNGDDVCTINDSPDEIPGTPPTKPPNNNIVSLKARNQKSIFDFYTQK